MNVFALFPGLVAVYYATQKSPAMAFIMVYIPVLFVMPDYYRWIGPGVPDPTMNQAAILPIAALFFMENSDEWRWDITDFLVGGFAISVSISQYLATGYKDAQNLIFDMLGSVVLPYVLAKAIIEPKQLRVNYAKVFVLVLVGVTAILAVEFRLGLNVYKLTVGRFFPGMGAGWVTNVRWGFGRAAGPYGHAILCGLIYSIGLLVQFWLHRTKAWPSKRFSQALLVILFVGMFMSLSRGPWIGAFLGLIVISVGFAKNRTKILIYVGVLGILVGVPVYLTMKSYLSVSRETATSATQETAAYRKELMEKYYDIAMEKAWWGWGLNTWPQLPGMPSIDNHYLNLALRHGCVALGFFFGIIVIVSLRLFIFGMKMGGGPTGTLAFTLLATYLATFFSIATVYLGEQARQLFFLQAGWAAGLMAWGADFPETADGKALVQPPSGPVPLITRPRILS